MVCGGDAYPYAVAMSNNEDPFIGLDGRCNAVMPQWQKPMKGVLQRFSQGHFCLRHRVAWPITNKGRSV